MEDKYQKFTHTSDEFIQELKDCIKNKKPLSLCRIGDGEIAILNRKTNMHIDSMADRWGYEGDVDSLIEDTRNIILSSIKHSDWLGVIGDTDFVNGWHEWYDGDSAESEWYLSHEYIKESGRKDPIKAVDAFIPRYLELGNIKELSKILNGNPIAIISPESEGLKARKIDERLGCKIHYVDVPHDCNPNDRAKLFKVLNDIPEHIVFTGWTLLGKEMNHLLYKKGKISLDMGAVIATWAGRLTRWDFKKDGPHHHCFELE